VNGAMPWIVRQGLVKLGVHEYILYWMRRVLEIVPNFSPS